MQARSGSFRNKLMVACALVAAAVLATPVAMAHEHRGDGDRTAAVVGALVVGAVIGGVVASASHHDHYYGGYYGGGYGYPAQSYPSGYYGGYPAYSYNSYPAYSYNSYPAYSYNGYPAYYGGYSYPPSYGSRVRIGVVYSNRGDRYRGREYRGRDDRSYGHWRGGDGDGDRGGRGHYYHGH